MAGFLSRCHPYPPHCPASPAQGAAAISLSQPQSLRQQACSNPTAAAPGRSGGARGCRVVAGPSVNLWGAACGSAVVAEPCQP